MSIKLLKIITELQALAKCGLSYSRDEYDRERYERILELSAQLSTLDTEDKYHDILELFSYDKGFTPKVDVRGAVFKDNKILLVQEKSDRLWTIPGGWADVNLTASENVLKELREETGYNCAVIKLIGVYDKNKSNPTPTWPDIYKIFFLCELLGEPMAPFCNEIQAIGFFDVNNLPALSKGRVNEEQIRNCFNHFNNRLLNSDFN